jgi:hypothetical protein
MERQDIQVGEEYLVREPEVGLRRIRVVADRGFGGEVKVHHNGWTADVTGPTPGRTMHIRAACHFIRSIPNESALPTDSLEEMCTTDLEGT